MNGHERQKEQSGQMIEAALIELMREKEFAKITVCEIVERADVARRTFYRLYGGKEEVLHRYFERLCQDYLERYRALACYEIRQIAGEFFGFWYQHRELLLLMHQCGLDKMLYYEISRFSVEVVKDRMGEVRIEEEAVECFAAYSAGGFILMLQHWIDGGMQGTPEEYARKISNALLKFIRPSASGKE